LIIPAGQRTATITLNAINNLKASGSRTATMTLQSGTGYSIGSNGNPSTTVTIK
jgi:hypothetical protein